MNNSGGDEGGKERGGGRGGKGMRGREGEVGEERKLSGRRVNRQEGRERRRGDGRVPCVPIYLFFQQTNPVYGVKNYYSTLRQKAVIGNPSYV